MKEKLMDGITVLSQGTKTEGLSISQGIILIVLASVMLLLCMVALFLYFRDRDYDWELLPVFVPIFMIAAISIIVVTSLNIGSKKEVKTYKVTINETVNFKEFDSKYEVLEKDGEIYTITLRDNSKK